MTKKPLLILDLDETLIHANVDIIHDNFTYRLPFHFVYERPHLSEFLNRINKFYDLAVWSSGTEDYVRDILDVSMPKNIELIFCWDRSHCSKRFDESFGSEVYVKDLMQVKFKDYPLERILIVDDSSEKIKINYRNAILIHPFTGSQLDLELPKLSSYLEAIAAYPNFMELNKKDWAKVKT